MMPSIALILESASRLCKLYREEEPKDRIVNQCLNEDLPGHILVGNERHCGWNGIWVYMEVTCGGKGPGHFISLLSTLNPGQFLSFGSSYDKINFSRDL